MHGIFVSFSAFPAGIHLQLFYWKLCVETSIWIILLPSPQAALWNGKRIFYVSIPEELEKPRREAELEVGQS